MNKASPSTAAHSLVPRIEGRIQVMRGLRVIIDADLATLRKAAGFTQTELANELGISQRMVAYYEQPDVTPPAHLLPGIAQMLGVSIDTL